MSNRDKWFNRIAMVITLVLVIIALWVMTASAATTDCPAGTYDAGGFCKNEPTGCPYGDSIPMDSPKCAPPVETPEPSFTPPTENDIAPVAAEESWGK